MVEREARSKVATGAALASARVTEAGAGATFLRGEKAKASTAARPTAQTTMVRWSTLVEASPLSSKIRRGAGRVAEPDFRFAAIGLVSAKWARFTKVILKPHSDPVDSPPMDIQLAAEAELEGPE